jgi:hypothetical protein
MPTALSRAIVSVRQTAASKQDVDEPLTDSRA